MSTTNESYYVHMASLIQNMAKNQMVNNNYVMSIDNIKILISYTL